MNPVGLQWGSVVGGHRNCIKQIWRMERIWWMDKDYGIVLEGSATRHPSAPTAPQTSTNHYRGVIERNWSDKEWVPGRGRQVRE